MRIVLHIGSSKTGTTALQTSLTQQAGFLARQGILYPAVRSRPINHHFLAMHLRERTGLPRVFRSIYKNRPDLLSRDFEANWNDVRRQIRKYKPHTLVLSSECLFNASDLERGAEFRDQLRQFSDDISIVAYIRQPSAMYLSGLQQTLKSYGGFHPPAAANFRQGIEFYETLFNCQANVAAYDRTTLANGDIVTDFVQRHLPTIDVRQLKFDPLQLNETLSAEIMSILQDYRRVNHPDADSVPSIEHRHFRMQLQALEHRFGLHRRPSMHEGIGHFIDHASVDLLWLRETRGISFRGIEYDAIRPAADNPYRNCSRVADICEVDEDRKQEILMRLMKKAVTPSIRMPAYIDSWLRRRLGNRTLRSIHAAMRAIKTRVVG